MPYVAEHKESCKDKSRYIITRKVEEFVDKRGSIVNNSDRGEVISERCASCNAPAKWKNGV